MHVLIIGGTGLISTAIVHELLGRGHEVTVCNRGQSESRIPASVKRIAADRRKYDEFEAEMRRHRFDAVIDMVAFHPDNARSVLRAFQGRADQIVVCSTCCVYGGVVHTMPTTEDEPFKPTGDYGRNKGEIERILLGANGRDGLHTTVIRPSYTTGEGATACGVLFDDSLPNRLRQGLPVIVHDGGRAPWAIAHVSDVARGFVNSLLNEKAFGQAYHLTSDEHTTWAGCYQALAEACGGHADIVDISTDWLYEAAPRRAVGVRYIYQYPSIFDNSKARRDLGFETTVPMVETFRRQVEWMECTGRMVPVEQERCEDLLIEAFRKGGRPDPERFVDWNPWGNGTTN